METPDSTPTPSAYGPVPSRRLGRSLGINNIPAKRCTYSCVYCQIGLTHDMRADRGLQYPPADVVRTVTEHVRQVRSRGEVIDYLSFVPTGEPTLDENLGHEILALKELGLKIAVITNGSLITRPDVRDDLAAADWVSLKVDAVDPRLWRRIDRPHGRLDLAAIQDGMRTFARTFTGTLATETMLVDGLNDDDHTLRDVAAFLAELHPGVSFLSVPIRPPASAGVQPPGPDTINRAYQLFRERLDTVELLLGYEGNEFATTGRARDDLLGITAVHPMKRDAVEVLLDRTGESWAVVDELLAAGDLVASSFDDETFYVRSPRRA